MDAYLEIKVQVPVDKCMEQSGQEAIVNMSIKRVKASLGKAGITVYDFDEAFVE